MLITLFQETYQTSYFNNHFIFELVFWKETFYNVLEVDPHGLIRDLFGTFWTFFEMFKDLLCQVQKTFWNVWRVTVKFFLDLLEVEGVSIRYRSVQANFSLRINLNLKEYVFSVYISILTWFKSYEIISQTRKIAIYIGNDQYADEKP